METRSIQVYAVKHRNMDTRMASRSGGIFTALSDWVLRDEGVIYGCILGKNFEALHTRAVTAAERNKMRGSKYIPSSMGDVFKQVKEDLIVGRKVLFSGTSCQVAGLLAYLEKNYNNLLCVDIVCHGVPSPTVWKSYLKWQEYKNKAKCEHVNFRNKVDFGWNAHVETLKMKTVDGAIKAVNSKIFKTIYYSHNILRPSCYYCPYKSTEHPSDITIADYWGIEKAAPGFSDNRGVSLVLVNNKRGVTAFQNVKKDVEWRECKLEDSIRPSLEKPFEVPSTREQFWKDFQNNDFSMIANKYGGVGFVPLIKKKLNNLLRK